MLFPGVIWVGGHPSIHRLISRIDLGLHCPIMDLFSSASSLLDASMQMDVADGRADQMLPAHVLEQNQPTILASIPSSATNAQPDAAPLPLAMHPSSLPALQSHVGSVPGSLPNALPAVDGPGAQHSQLDSDVSMSDAHTHTHTQASLPMPNSSPAAAALDASPTPSGVVKHDPDLLTPSPTPSPPPSYPPFALTGPIDGLCRLCVKCGQYRFVPNVTALPVTTTMWDCTQHPDPLWRSCDVPSEPIADGKLTALRTYRLSEPWNYSTLGLLPFDEITYHILYRHERWSLFETIVLLEKVCELGPGEWNTIARDPVLHVRHNAKECQTRLLHLLAMGAVYGQSLTSQHVLLQWQADASTTQQPGYMAPPPKRKYRKRETVVDGGSKTTATGRSTRSSGTRLSSRLAGKQQRSYVYDEEEFSEGLEDADMLLPAHQVVEEVEPEYIWKIEKSQQRQWERESDEQHCSAG